MDRTTIFDIRYPDCPIRNVLARICDKWAILVVFTLDRAGVPAMRFGEIQKALPDISRRMLTITLRTLEEDGLVRREMFAEIPPRVEYSLTERARSLLPHVNALIEWAGTQMPDVVSERKRKSQAAQAGGNADA